MTNRNSNIRTALERGGVVRHWGPRFPESDIVRQGIREGGLMNSSTLKVDKPH